MSSVRRLVLGSLVLLGSMTTVIPISVTAQTPPPIPGHTGTIALEGTVKQLYRAANTIVVGTIDGVERVLHYTRALIVHGATGDAGGLRGLREGSSVVVHYSMEGTSEAAHEIDRLGDEGLKTTEGVVTRIDRAHKEITIKFADGTRETLQLTDRAAVDAGNDVGRATAGTTKVIVYYSDKAGHKVAHFFKKIS
jgi:hypothetical protein